MKYLPSWFIRARLRRLLWPAASAITVLAILLVAAMQLTPESGASRHAFGPPWVYGAPTARFTLVEYADLECPYCQAYFPVLHQWIDAHHDVNWQWHHLPLTMHDPAAWQEARLVECVGRVGGQSDFWKAAAWVYGHTRSNGDGLPAGTPYPNVRTGIKTCLAGTQADDAIRREIDDAQRDQIQGTPMLRLIDHRTGQTLVIRGAADGDTLLSAIDQLIASGTHASSSGSATATETAR
ncbi:MAG TPA: thioredoxin domain-containing protein [Rhodanobacter sp.]|nr:thioredoxin domain-containing protein [Rhodanobacter sp.]